MGVKISNLPPIVSPALSDVFPVSSAGVTYKETITQLAALIHTSGGGATFTPPSVPHTIAVFSNNTGNIESASGTAFNAGSIQAGLDGTAGCFIAYPSSANSGTLNLCAVNNATGDFNTTISNASAVGQSQVISIPDAGAATSNFIISNSPITQSIATPTASANPGVLIGLECNLDQTVSTMTAGIISGSYASTDLVSISGGTALAAWAHIIATDTVSGTGEVVGLAADALINNATAGRIVGILGGTTVTGTISGTSQIFGIGGSLEMTGGTINGAHVYGSFANVVGTAPTQTNMANTHGLAFFNDTAAVFNSQIYLVGDAAYALEIASATTYVATPGGSTPSGNLRTLKVYINGAAYYILAAAVYS